MLSNTPSASDNKSSYLKVKMTKLATSPGLSFTSGPVEQKVSAPDPGAHRRAKEHEHSHQSSSHKSSRREKNRDLHTDPKQVGHDDPAKHTEHSHREHQRDHAHAHAHEGRGHGHGRREELRKQDMMGLNRDAWNHVTDADHLTNDLAKDISATTDHSVEHTHITLKIDTGKKPGSEPASIPDTENAKQTQETTADSTAVEQAPETQPLIASDPTPTDPASIVEAANNKLNESQSSSHLSEKPQKPRRAADMSSGPLDAHSPIRSAPQTTLGMMLGEDGNVVTKLSYDQALGLYTEFTALDKESHKLTAGANRESATTLPYQEYRQLRNRTMLRSCLSIEKQNPSILSTDIEKRIYQSSAIREIYFQMDHGSEPVSIAQDQLQVVRRTIQRDRHALNKMMGSEAKQQLKQKIYGNKLSNFNITDIVTKTICTAGTMEQPDIDAPDARAMQLHHYYPTAPPSILLQSELRDIVKLKPEELFNYKDTCSTLVAEIGYILNQVTDANSKSVASKIISLLHTYLIPKTLPFLAISLLVFCTVILEKAALERVFVSTYAAIFTDIASNSSLATHLLKSYHSYNHLFKVKCVNNQKTGSKNALLRNFLTVTFRELMELKLEDMLYNIDLNVPFFKRIKAQHITLDRKADGTVIEYGEHEQQLIDDYIKELQHVYMVGLAEFAGHLHACRTAARPNAITPAALRRIFLNLVCYNFSCNYITKAETWTKYLHKPHFNKLYLPSVNTEINCLYVTKSYRKRLNAEQFAPEHLPNYSLYEAAISLLKIVLPHLQYFIAEKFSTRLEADLKSLLAQSSSMVSKNDQKTEQRELLFKSKNDIKDRLCEEQFYSVLSASKSAKNYNMLLKYLFASSTCVDMMFPLFRVLMGNGDATVYNILIEEELEDVLKQTPEEIPYYTAVKTVCDEKHYKDVHAGLRSPGEVVHRLAEKFEIEKNILRMTELYADLSSFYFRFVSHMKADATHTRHFRFLLMNLEEEMQSWLTKFPKSGPAKKIAMLSNLEQRLNHLLSTLRKHSLLPVDRPQNAAFSGDTTAKAQSASSSATTSAANIRAPITQLPSSEDERKKLLERLHKEALESSLLTAVQFVFNLEYNQDTGTFTTKSVDWVEILSTFLVYVASGAPSVKILSVIIGGVPDVINAIDESARDPPQRLLDSLLCNISIHCSGKPVDADGSQILLENFTFLLATLVQKQVLSFGFVVKNLEAHARKEEYGYKLGQMVVARFLRPANEDDNSPSEKLLDAAKTMNLQGNKSRSDKHAVYDLVNYMCALFTKAIPSDQILVNVYNVLQMHDALSDVFTIYNIVLCEDAVQTKCLPISTVFLDYLERNSFLFTDDYIHSIFDSVFSIALSFLSNASKDELAKVFGALRERFASQNVSIGALGAHVLQRWKETMYCSRDFLLLWTLLIESQFCTKAEVVTYIETIPSRTDTKKKIQESEEIRAWIGSE